MNVTSKQPALNLNRDVKLQLLGGKYKNEINTAKTKAAITDARWEHVDSTSQGTTTFGSPENVLEIRVTKSVVIE